MRRNLPVAVDVFQAGELVWKDCSQQVFRFHALQRRRNLASSALAWQREGTGGVPSPADRKHRCVKQRLRQKIAHCFAIKVTEDLIKRKGVLCAQREHNRVVGRRCLQLKIKGTTEPFAQGQSPSSIHPNAEWGVDHQLHSSRLIKEALHNKSLLRWNDTQRPEN